MFDHIRDFLVCIRGQPSTTRQSKSKRHSHDSEMKEKCQAFAKGRIQEDARISEVIADIQIEPMVANAHGEIYTDATIRKWIAPLFPVEKRRGGRPKKPSQQ